MESHNKKLGEIGEGIARDYLEDRGYQIVEQNFQNRWGEIDLICQKDKIMVFVEVKTRVGERFGTPEDAINSEKKKRLLKNANAYMVFKKQRVDSYRIDGICIVLNEIGEIKRINHYENIMS